MWIVVVVVGVVLAGVIGPGTAGVEGWGDALDALLDAREARKIAESSRNGNVVNL
jgi:hypothetical protein